MKTKNLCKINSNRKTSKQIYSKIDQPFEYKNNNFGISANLTGKGVKICIVDTGEPSHKDIKNIGQSVDLSDPKGSPLDTHGHSTMLSGIIGSYNKKNIIGLAPGAELMFAKVSGNDNKCSPNCVVAGILWAVVKGADVILISLSSESNYNLLHDAVKKAYNSNICVIAASGNSQNKIEYPAFYPEALSVSKRNSSKRAKKFITSGGNTEMVLPATDVYTTYLDNKYTKASGSSLAAATAASLAALIIEGERGGVSKSSPRSVYAHLSSLSYSD